MLRIWLPLTKDLRQQGLSNVTVTNNGATFSSAGKLGGCYEFTSGKRIQTTLPPTGSLNSKAISFACWINISSWNSSYDCLMSIADGTGWQQSRATLSRNNTASTLTWNIADGSTSTRVSTTTSLSTNTWYHIACTYDGASLKIYVNGTLDNSAAATLSIGYAGTFNIGGWSGNNYPINCKMNDVRVYSHCLSPMEVKELAKGLVLHYPLNRNGWGQENLDNFRSYTNNWTMESLSGSNYTDSTYGNVIKLTTSAANQRMYHHVTSTLWQSGQVYTVSFLAKADVNGRTCNMSRSIADFSPTFTLTTNWKRYSGQITSTATPGGGTLSFRIHQSGATVYITQIKLEKGTIATPYCPSSSEALYTTMGLNSTTEYDCSGFCNNGTRSGTFSWTSNTAKYAVSTKFNGTDNAIQTPSLPTMITDKNYTIAVWIYKTVIGSKGYQTIYGGPSGFEIEARNGSANETKFVPWNWGKPMASYELNEWNHCVFVHSNADCKIYLNGEYIATGTAKASNPTGNYFVGAWNTATQQNFDGLMSDFRIYATALSASDVKSLYQNCATIDPDGTIRGQIRS